MKADGLTGRTYRRFDFAVHSNLLSSFVNNAQGVSPVYSIQATQILCLYAIIILKGV